MFGVRSGDSGVWVLLCMLWLCSVLLWLNLLLLRLRLLLLLRLLRTHRSAGCCWVISPLGCNAPAALLVSLLQTTIHHITAQHTRRTDEHSMTQHDAATCNAVRLPRSSSVS
jgi:hypothetical protein